MKKQNKKILWFLLMFIALGMFVSGSFSFVSTSLSMTNSLAAFDDSNVFLKPLEAHMICEKMSTFTWNTPVLASKDTNTWLSCGDKATVDSCDIYLGGNSSSWYTGWFQTGDLIVPNIVICDENGLGCDKKEISVQPIQVGPVAQKIATINTGQKIRIWCEHSVLGIPGINVDCQVSKVYQRYRLIDNYGGKAVLNEQDCTIPSNIDLTKILFGEKSTETKVNCNIGPIFRGEWCNYVHEWVYGPQGKVLKYEGQDVYCSNHKLYEVKKIQLQSGDWKLLDPTATINSNGNVINGATGKIVSDTIQCCPGDYLCGDDFMYHPAETSQCKVDAECANGGGYNKIDCYTLGQETCVSNKCILNTQNNKEVKCTSSSCCASGTVCDLGVGSKTQNTCIETKGDFCGDSKCLGSENKNTCPDDCGDKTDKNQSLLIPILLIVGGIIMALLLINKKKAMTGSSAKLF